MKERCEELLGLFALRRDELTHSLNAELSFGSDGHSIITIGESKLIENPIGGVNGAILGYLVDYTGWFAAAQHYQSWISTINYKVDCLSPGKPKALRAVANVVSPGKRICVCQAEVFDNDGSLIALGTSSYVLSVIPFRRED